MKITYEQYLDWNHNVFARNNEEQRRLRLGQSFCNHFNITDPELFYEVDYKKAAALAKDRYVETNGV